MASKKGKSSRKIVVIEHPVSKVTGFREGMMAQSYALVYLRCLSKESAIEALTKVAIQHFIKKGKKKSDKYCRRQACIWVIALPKLNAKIFKKLPSMKKKVVKKASKKKSSKKKKKHSKISAKVTVKKTVSTSTPSLTTSAPVHASV